MESGKLDNPLNLALTIDNELREKTIDLEVGFQPETSTWELIVKYSGSIEWVAAELGASFVPLLNGYAILRIREEKINDLTSYEEIEFIEKPNRMFFELTDGKGASCIPPRPSASIVSDNNISSLSGAGVLVAIIDSGIDVFHPDFRKEDGTTRLLYLWDQTLPPTNPPPGFQNGRLFTESEINEAIKNPEERAELIPSLDQSAHGTAVAGIACGNGRASEGRNTGIAYQSPMIVVKLGTPINRSFPRTTQLMEAVDFCVRKALERNQPIAINLSFGNNYGSHDGNSLLERYLDDVSGFGRSFIVTGTGNEGASGHHVHGTLTDRSRPIPLNTRSSHASQRDPYLHIIEIGVGENEPSYNLQLWKNYFDVFDVSVTSPSNRVYGPIPNTPGTTRFVLDETEILLFYGEPKPYNISQELYFEFIPYGAFRRSIAGGIWKINLNPRQIITGSYSFYLPTGEVIGPNTRFLRPTENTTLTIPSTASRVISVGAYDANTERYAYFSGRGFLRKGGPVKPELVAPGVSILTAAPGGSYSNRTGTSFAAPFVTGCAALMMEWGILRGNDPYLYGEKIKAYLIKGAKPLPSERIYPNPTIGFGTLCFQDSFPVS